MTLFIDVTYLLVTVLLAPFLIIRRLIQRKPIRHFLRRFGRTPDDLDARPVVWLHGVSVGEVLAAREFVAELERRRPDLQVVVSTTTHTGHDVAVRHYGANRVFFSPLDFSFAVRRVLRRLRPVALVLVETELWPNLLGCAAKRGVPAVVVNGKLSRRSARGYRRLLRLMPRFLDPIQLFCMQNDDYAERLREIVVETSRVVVAGNLKADNLPLALDPDEARTLRTGLGLADRPVWLAGSTHEGEEALVLDAFRRLRTKVADLTLVLVPRHPERLEAVVALVKSADFACVAKTAVDRRTDIVEDILVVDTMGELARLFSVADVVFLGGSLVPVGGHNILEPAAGGRPVVSGPHVWTVRDLMSELEQVDAVRVVHDAEGLADGVGAWLSDVNLRRAAGERARAVVDRHRGATRRTVDAVMRCLPDLPGNRRVGEPEQEIERRVVHDGPTEPRNDEHVDGRVDRVQTKG